MDFPADGRVHVFKQSPKEPVKEYTGNSLQDYPHARGEEVKVELGEGFGEVEGA